jgi:hypothetical protein
MPNAPRVYDGTPFVLQQIPNSLANSRCWAVDVGLVFQLGGCSSCLALQLGELRKKESPRSSACTAVLVVNVGPGMPGRMSGLPASFLPSFLPFSLSPFLFFRSWSRSSPRMHGTALRRFSGGFDLGSPGLRSCFLSCAPRRALRTPAAGLLSSIQSSLWFLRVLARFLGIMRTLSRKTCSS